MKRLLPRAHDACVCRSNLQVLHSIIFLFIFYPTSHFLTAQSSLPAQMAFVQGGTFTMGCTNEQFPDCQSDELPTMEVTLSDFYMGKYEITQGQWLSLMGNTQANLRDLVNPNFPLTGIGSGLPVYYVSWFFAAVFCNKLSEQEGYAPCYFADANFTQIYGKSAGNYQLTQSSSIFWNQNANGYRLPTEAEWEYAARGGNKSQGFKYAGTSNVNLLRNYCNYFNGGDGYDNIASPVGAYLPNELDLYDMNGNMWEWCWDWYDPQFYNIDAVCSPTGGVAAEFRLLRGGSWGNAAAAMHISNRGGGVTPITRGNQYSFRICRGN